MAEHDLVHDHGYSLDAGRLAKRIDGLSDELMKIDEGMKDSDSL